jgi:hypothetical protein
VAGERRKRTFRLPRLYASCGRQDELLPLNRIFYQRAQALGFPLTYVEADGIHDWFFGRIKLHIFSGIFTNARSNRVTVNMR